MLRAATELRIATVAIYSHEDRFALHRFKSDESYQVGAGKSPIQAYLDIEDIIRIAVDAGVDAIHPGYGFLSENPDFADAVRAAGIAFVGPKAQTMRSLGNKVAARELAEAAGVPVMPASGALPVDDAAIAALGERVGFPVMLKASWGGGGRGMRIVRTPSELLDAVGAARRESLAAFGNDEVFLEKYIEHARHIEVQILGDSHGTIVHLGERDCTVQRRHQKVIEEAPARDLPADRQQALTTAALAIARSVGYDNAGTVEFLFDRDDNAFYFIEVNPRIQVEHTVTEVVTGIDLVKAQIRIAGGAVIGTELAGVPFQEGIVIRGHALQCRITTEDPRNNFTPTYGQLIAYRPATGFGVRLDGGTAYAGAVVTPFYDSLLEKVTVWAPTFDETRMRMLRALREFRIRGVATNVTFLDALLESPTFVDGTMTTRFLDEHPPLTEELPRRDRATRLLSFIGDVMINGNGEVKGRRPAEVRTEPVLPKLDREPAAPGTRQLFEKLGPEKFAAWMLEQKRVLVTDTTMRDAHQSLLATRMRTRDMVRIAPAYAKLLPDLFSLECWGGATFDVAMRFLREDPWLRLEQIRAAVPNVLLQMLLRGANGVGYTNYPDNVVNYFVAQAARGGIDVFRIFDALNWVENMRVSIEAVLESGKLCEVAMCYTGDILDPRRPKYDLAYYVALAKEIEATGAHVLGIKDMAGLLKPEAAKLLVRALKSEVGIPIHFHTHDTSGNSAASVLAAIESGVDAVDGAIDAMSGLTSQPNLGSIVAALQHTPRETGIDLDAIHLISDYWEGVRKLYRPFESEMRAGSSDVYLHEMPGGQYTNLREQADSMGLGERWPSIVTTYARVNRMFGDIVKVTPTSKVVGDMALFMESSGTTEEDVLDPTHDIGFPQSVVEFFRGDLGQPPGGFPAALQRKVLNGIEPLVGRPGASLAAVDLAAVREKCEELVGRHILDTELASYLMYPSVFVEYAKHEERFGPVETLETAVFFYGLQIGQEIAIEMERGKTLLVRYAALGEVNERGFRQVYFELNGQPRTLSLADRRSASTVAAREKAESGNPNQIGAPMPGQVAAIAVTPGLHVAKGAPLLTIEAMKMQTNIASPHDGTIKRIVTPVGAQIEAGDLMIEFA